MISMEKLRHPIVVDTAALAAGIDAFASTKTKAEHLECAYKLFFSHSYKYDRDITATAVEEYRETLKAWLRAFAGQDNGPSQRHFWNFFDDVTVRKSPQHVGYVVAHEVFHKALARGNRNISGLSRPSFFNRPPMAVSDGQHRWVVAYESSSRDLSVRAVRSVLLNTIEQLDNVGEAPTVFDLLEVLDNSLIREVAKRIRWRDRTYRFDLERNTAPSTREWVLGFLFRTGNPPPQTGKLSPADGWAIVTIITDARREDYATIQGQEISRDLRNTICKHGARARFNRGTQNHANHGGGWQPARYWLPLPDHSLAQCA
jgi:hypothetical protein